MRARVSLLLALISVVLLSACTNPGKRPTAEQRDRASEELIDSLSD